MILKKIGLALSWIVECGGALVAAAGVVLLYVSSLAWLKVGVWPPGDLQTFSNNAHSQWPHVEWTGVQRIIELMPTVILQLPLWAVFLTMGGSIYAIGFVTIWLLEASIYQAK